MDEFEAVGCKVTPYPVDFRTGDSTPLTEYALAQSLLRWQTALHEWLRLWVCGVTAWVGKKQRQPSFRLGGTLKGLV
jgi:hypothetical protein